MTFDWKFLLTALLALAGIAVPVLLWQADLNSNAINITLKSSVALQSGANAAIPDLRIVVGEATIESPYLSTLELVNSGTKPIPSSNFEGPMEISSSTGSKILRAKVSSSKPIDLKASVDVTSEMITIAPLLLNPKDTVTLAILTSGSQPKFSARSRIAGISRISFEDETTKNGRWKVFAFYLPVSFLSLILYFIFAFALIRPNHFVLSRPLCAAIALTSGAGAGAILRRSYELLEMDNEHYSKLLIIGAATIVGISVYIYLIVRKRASSGA